MTNNQQDQGADQFSEWMTKFALGIYRLSQRSFVLMKKAWDWYNSINWPDIPLSPLQWIFLFYAIFGLIFLWATPIFEASDELWHFGMVETIAETRTLPVQDVDNRDTIYRQEGSQPPLYYTLSAAVVSFFDLSNVEQFREPNPHALAGIPGAFGNKNLVLHPPFSLTDGVPLAVYTLRVISLLMGAVTVWAVYQIASIIAPHRPVIAIVAGAITAFNPMFLFIAASVNNDNLVIMLNSLVIWLMILTFRDGFDSKRSLALSVLLALGTLTKLSALVLVPVIAIGAIWLAFRTKNWRGLLVLGSAMLFFWLLIAGWWYLRNWQLYGELFGTTTMALVAGERIQPFDITTLFAEFQGFRLSYWGVFGAFNIQTTSLFYTLVDFAVFLGIGGVIFLVAQLSAIQDFSFARRELTQILFLAGIVLVGLIAFINWTAQTYASQGRLMFPFLGALSPLLAIGFVEVVWWFLFLISPPERSFVRAGEAVPEPFLNMTMRWQIRVLGIFAILIPLFTIAPNYAPPQPITTLPEGTQTVYARYGDAVELIGYDYSDRRYFPGERVRITLYWRVLETTDDDWSIGLTLIDPDGHSLGGLDTYPGAGTLRTSQWQAGEIYADTYEVQLRRDIEERSVFFSTIYWYQGAPENRVAISDTQAVDIASVRLNMGAIVLPETNLNLSTIIGLDEIPEVERNFQGTVRVAGYGFVPDIWTVRVQWQAISTGSETYKSFAHIYDEQGTLVGQYDLLPVLPTRYWYFSENYLLDYPIEMPDDLPAGTYSVETGWYVESDPNIRLQIDLGEAGIKTTYQLFTFTVLDDGSLVLPEALALLEVTPEVTAEPVAAPPDATAIPRDPNATPLPAEVGTSQP